MSLTVYDSQVNTLDYCTSFLMSLCGLEFDRNCSIIKEVSQPNSINKIINMNVQCKYSYKYIHITPFGGIYGCDTLTDDLLICKIEWFDLDNKVLTSRLLSFIKLERLCILITKLIELKSLTDDLVS